MKALAIYAASVSFLLALVVGCLVGVHLGNVCCHKPHVAPCKSPCEPCDPCPCDPERKPKPKPKPHPKDGGGALPDGNGAIGE